MLLVFFSPKIGKYFSTARKIGSKEGPSIFLNESEDFGGFFLVVVMVKIKVGRKKELKEYATQVPKTHLVQAVFF